MFDIIHNNILFNVNYYDLSVIYLIKSFQGSGDFKISTSVSSKDES